MRADNGDGGERVLTRVVVVIVVTVMLVMVMMTVTIKIVVVVLITSKMVMMVTVLMVAFMAVVALIRPALINLFSSVPPCSFVVRQIKVAILALTSSFTMPTQIPVAMYRYICLGVFLQHDPREGTFCFIYGICVCQTYLVWIACINL